MIFDTPLNERPLPILRIRMWPISKKIHITISELYSRVSRFAHFRKAMPTAETMNRGMHIHCILNNSY